MLGASSTNETTRHTITSVAIVAENPTAKAMTNNAIASANDEVADAVGEQRPALDLAAPTDDRIVVGGMSGLCVLGHGEKYGGCGTLLA